MARNFRVFTQEEEAELARRWKRDGDQKARSMLAASLDRLAVSIARQYVSPKDPIFEDLAQEGRYGILKAIEKYDPDLGYRLITLAKYHVNSYVYKALYGPKKRKVPEPILESLEQILRNTKSLSLLETVEDNQSFPEIIAGVESSEEKQILTMAAVVLNGSEKHVLLRRFGSGQELVRLEDIGKELRVTRQRVHQIEQKAIKKLREAIDKKSPLRPIPATLKQCA